MKVTIFGSGYVGLVTGACLAEVGNDVVCVDVDQEKVDRLNDNIIPIYEPGLEALILKNRESGRLRFTTDIKAAVSHGLFQFIAVGTPPDDDGAADLQQVLAVADSIGSYMTDFKVVITKSTVPVGTAAKVKGQIADSLKMRNISVPYEIVSNPEFLKEGAAISDFMRPDRLIIGCEDPRTMDLLKVLYGPFNRNHDRLKFMDIPSAELTKYAANAMLASRISFMNELSGLAESVNADIENVREGIGSDPRIGYDFLYAGCGYGGSCFPKDIKALIRTGKEFGKDLNILQAVEKVNDEQKILIYRKINDYFDGSIAKKRFAIWGLSFKPNTDDMREAPSRTLIHQLSASGAYINAFDPESMAEAKRIYGKTSYLTYCSSAEEAINDADALVILTDWSEFKSPNFNLIKEKLKKSVIFDGRNMFKPSLVRSFGLDYHGIGRK